MKNIDFRSSVCLMGKTVSGTCFRNHSTSLNLLKLFEISNALIGILSGVNTKIENLFFKLLINY